MRQVVEPVDGDHVNAQVGVWWLHSWDRTIPAGTLPSGSSSYRKMPFGNPGVCVSLLSQPSRAATILGQAHLEEPERHTEAGDGGSAERLPGPAYSLVFPGENLGAGWRALDVDFDDISGQSLARTGSRGM